MSPRSIATRSLRDPEALRTGDAIERAVRRLLESELPALPVIDANGIYKGIFGEREFMSALFPGYLDQLKSAAFLNRSLDETLEKRESCRSERVDQHMNREHIDVGPDHSDLELAEIFLHHRVLVVPVVADGHLEGLLTRRDFFRAIAERFVAS